MCVLVVIGIIATQIVCLANIAQILGIKYHSPAYSSGVTVQKLSKGIELGNSYKAVTF